MQKAPLFGFALALASSFSLVAACDHSPPFSVEKARLGEHSPLVTGDALRVSRPAQEGYEGIHSGYYVVHTPEEWNALFERGKERPVPQAVDFARNMVIVAAGGNDLQKTHVHRVVDTANTIHVYVEETLRGAGCNAEKGASAPYEVDITDRIDKTVKVHVDTAQSPGCGNAPTATVKCRKQNVDTWSPEKLIASPGDTVECDAAINAQGSFVVVDKSWQFTELPGGSLSKMAFTRESMRVAFTVDLFGTYKATFEVADEADRRGHATGIVEVLAPKTQDPFIQMLWAGFDTGDDPSTFPRVELTVKDMPARGKKESTCTLTTAANAAQKPAFCDIKGSTTLTDLKLDGGAGKPYLVGVHYIDDRYDGGPYVCLRVYLNGSRTADTCDRAKRGADDTWSLGALDGTTGTFMDAREAYARSVGLYDAGAPNGAPQGDGGSMSAPPSIMSAPPLDGGSASKPTPAKPPATPKK